MLQDFGSASCLPLKDFCIVIGCQLKDQFAYNLSKFIESKIQSIFKNIQLPDIKQSYTNVNYTNIITNQIHSFNDGSPDNPLNVLDTFYELNVILFYTLNSNSVYKISEIQKLIDEIKQESQASEINFI